MKKLILYILCIIPFMPQSFFAQETELFETKFSLEQLVNAPAALIPFPDQINWENDFIEIQGVLIEENGVVSQKIIEELISILEINSIKINNSNNFICQFIKDDSFKKEEYELNISKSGITIKAAQEAGHFYALQTLRQLIQTKNGKQVIPICEIRDKPAFEIRGFLLDVGRNFQSLESLKKQLDIMAKYKLNVFQWHLTDRPAWRIESKMYPQLTASENHRQTRDPGQFYSYDDIRKIIKYARDRHIAVIPEIDMPGHSDSFVKAMGVKMESKKGMEILENILDEFFSEISKTDCPIIHIGSDEVHVNNPDEFISHMVNFCEEDGRKVVIWNPGLKAKNAVIRQTWRLDHVENGGYQEIDSWNNYINNGEPMTQIQRLFFRPIGYPSVNAVLGGIICLWPDVNLENESDAFSQNPVYSSLLTYAWTTWTADILQAPESYYMTLPTSGSFALNYFAAFEKILVAHKEKYFQNDPFPYFLQHDKKWKVIGPFEGNEGDELLTQISDSYSYKNQNLTWKKAVGNTLIIKDRFKLGGHFPNAKKGQTAYALTYIHADKNKIVDTWIGFETPMRANRTYNGIPEAGHWDASGGNISINDMPLPAPIWENPGWKPSKKEGWGSPKDQEIAWTNEELFWTRTPTKVSLKKGWNKVFVKIPGSTDYQNWMFTFIPLNMDGLRFATNPNIHSTYYDQRKSHFEKLPNDEKEIIFIGDSIIDGCEWSEMFSQKNIKNRGISGDVTQGVLDRLDEVTESKPEKVFLMIGTNDLARGISSETVIENLGLIIKEINTASPQTKVYVHSILPVNDYYENFSGHTSKGAEIALVNLAIQNRLMGDFHFIDLYGAFTNSDQKLDINLTNDGLHLNGDGYQLWAAKIKEYIK